MVLDSRETLLTVGCTVTAPYSAALCYRGYTGADVAVSEGGSLFVRWHGVQPVIMLDGGTYVGCLDLLRPSPPGEAAADQSEARSREWLKSREVSSLSIARLDGQECLMTVYGTEFVVGF